MIAVLGRLLLEEAPAVRELRGGVPAALDALVSQMLAKDPAARPADGAAIAAALRALGPRGSWAPPPGCGEGARELFGRPSPFVDRDREMEALLHLFDEC